MSKEKDEHVDFQRSYFDHNVAFFKSPIPDDVIERSREIVRSIIPDPSVRLLDVGTGIGAFIRFYLEIGIAETNFLGCDLSEQMLAEAKMRYPQLKFWLGDILELPEEYGKFDVIVFNACFGNIFDQDEVIKKSSKLLNKKGRIAISHPMGNAFVGQLKEMCPHLIFSLLPDRKKLENWAAQLDMKLSTFRDEPVLYLAILELNS